MLKTVNLSCNFSVFIERYLLEFNKVGVTILQGVNYVRQFELKVILFVCLLLGGRV